ALRRREIRTHDVSSRVRLTKSPAKYGAARAKRRELPYEAMIASGRKDWDVGDRVRVYRTRVGEGRVVEAEDEADLDRDRPDARDYDAEHYVRVLRENFASRLARAFSPEDFDSLFADPEQPSLFEPSFESMGVALREARST